MYAFSNKEDAFLISHFTRGEEQSIKVHTGRLRPGVKKVSLSLTFYFQMVPLSHT